MGNLLDVNDEFLLLPYKNGIKLIPPGNELALPCIKEFLINPFNIYFYNTEYEVVKMNEDNLTSFGLPLELKNNRKKVYELPFIQQSIEQLVNNNKQVMVNQTKLIVEEELVIQDTAAFKTLTVKAPLYNNQDKVVGVFGCSIVIGVQNLANALATLANLGLLNQPLNKHPHEELFNQLTAREKQVLKRILSGYTAPEIATLLNLSKRTVEQYIDTLKIKLEVDSKNALLKKFNQVNLDF